MTPEEIRKLEAYFKRNLNKEIVLKARGRKDESAEVYIADEFLGVIFRDDEDGELSYNFTMAILVITYVILFLPYTAEYAISA